MNKGRLSKRFLRDIMSGKIGFQRNQPYALQIKRNDDGTMCTVNIVNSKWQVLSTIAEFRPLQPGESAFLCGVHRGFQIEVSH